MLSGGQRCGQRGDGVVAQEEAIVVDISRGAAVALHGSEQSARRCSLETRLSRKWVQKA
jgi:hypothetical protein